MLLPGAAVKTYTLALPNHANQRLRAVVSNALYDVPIRAAASDLGESTSGVFSM